MNKTIIININGIVFHIEEDAYETLRAYMIDIKRHFGKSEESKEILEDIENRIAEMFSDRIQAGRKEVINIDDVNQVIAQMGRVSDFEEAVNDENSFASEEKAQEKQQAETPSPEEEPLPRATYFSKRLMRDPEDTVIGGICSGLGHYFGLEAKWVRVLFVLFTLLGGSGILLYIVLWIVIPQAISRADKMAMRGEAPNLQNFKKSFEEEMENIGTKFSRASDHIGNGARSIGGFLEIFFRIVAKIIGFTVLIIVGFSILGLFIFFVTNILNLMGYQNPMYFPPLKVLGTTDSFAALLAGFIATTVPFIALFYLLLRGLFGIKPMNNYASLTLFTTWVLSIIAILYFVVVTAQDFREKSTIKVEQKIDARPAYVFFERDVRVIDASGDGVLNKKIHIDIEGQSLEEYLRSELRVDIEPLDSLEQPYIQYRYSAKGRSYRQASDRASEIKYQATQQDDNLYFDSHFALENNSIYRDQRVDATVFLPVGTKVTIMNDLRHKVSARIHDCNPELNGRSTEWIMTKNGLKCLSTNEDQQGDQSKGNKKNDEADATSGDRFSSLTLNIFIIA